MLSSTAWDSVGTDFRLNLLIYFFLARKEALESGMHGNESEHSGDGTAGASKPVQPLIMHHARKDRPEPSTNKREPYPKLSLSQPSARQTSACHCLNLLPSQRRATKDDDAYNWCERLGRWLLLVALLPRASRADFTGLTRSCHSFSGPRH